MKENVRIHSLLIEAVAQALFDIFNSRRHADKVIEFYFKKNKKWGSRDRKFIAESVYEVVRWWRFLWWLKGESEIPEQLDNESLKSIWAHWWAWKKRETIEPYINQKDFQKIKEREGQSPSSAFFYSVPDWLYERGKNELRDKNWDETLEALNTPALVYLRVNTLKIPAHELILKLKEEGIEAQLVSNQSMATAAKSLTTTTTAAQRVTTTTEAAQRAAKIVEAQSQIKSAPSNPDTGPTDLNLKLSDGCEPEALFLLERKNVFITKSFKQGLFEVQDWSSQQVAPFLDVKPGMRVVDACAGAGGKSLHLATLMKNKGKIIALDIHERKLKELRTRASRGGIDIIEARLIDGQKTLKRMESSADRLLLDVPCSGVGVLRRNPDTKWKLSNDEITRLIEIQKDILFNYSKILKPGGKLVYSTCSILPSENGKQVLNFLDNSSQYILVKEKTYFPQDQNSDGFYMALIERMKER